MHPVETCSLSGEDEGANNESPMKSAFRDQSGIYTKLTQIGITNLEQVVGLNDQELDELCGPDMLDLKGDRKIEIQISSAGASSRKTASTHCDGIHEGTTESAKAGHRCETCKWIGINIRSIFDTD